MNETHSTTTITTTAPDVHTERCNRERPAAVGAGVELTLGLRLDLLIQLPLLLTEVLHVFGEGRVGLLQLEMATSQTRQSKTLSPIQPEG